MVTRRNNRWPLAVVCAGVVLAGAGCRAAGAPAVGAAADSSASSSGAGSPAPPASSSPPTATAAGADGSCGPARLDISIGAANSAKFQEAAPLRFVNRGDRACTLSGFPRLVFLHDGRPMPVAVVHDDGTTAGTVRLEPGGAAEALLIWNKYEGQGSTCSPRPTEVDVTAPGQATAQTVAWWSDPVVGSVCGGTVRIRAVGPPA